MRILIPLIALLAGCQKSEGVGREEYERLQTRVAQLEGSVAELRGKSGVKTSELKEAPSTLPKTKSQPVYTYRLIGSSSDSDISFPYVSREKCEDAKEALLESWQEELEAMNPRPVIKFRPSPACIPV